MKTTITLSKKDLTRINDLAQARYYSNRQAGNKNDLKRTAGKEPWSTDVLGLMGEFGVCRAFGVNTDTHQFVFEQSEFNKIKNTMKDVLDYEVKTVDKAHLRMCIPAKQAIKYAKETKVISCVAVLNIDGTATVTLRGWATANDVVVNGILIDHYTPAYYLDTKHLKSFAPPAFDINDYI